MLRLVFTLLTLTAGHAATIDSCEIELIGGRVLPVIEIDETDLGYEKFDALARRVDWARLTGRLLRVRYVEGGQVISSTNQRILTRADLLRQYPGLAYDVNRINSNFLRNNQSHTRSRGFRARGVLRTLLGLGKDHRAFARFFPGEFGSVVLFSPGQRDSSELLSSWDNPTNRTASERLTQIIFNPALESIQQNIVEALEKRPQERTRLHLILVHNHPGVVAPLGTDDLNVLDWVADNFSKHYDNVEWTFSMIALGTLRDVGDVAFIRTIKPPVREK